MKTTVALIKHKNPELAVQKVLEIIDIPHLISPDEKILIKPNYLCAKHPSTGVTTDTRVISAIIQFVKKCGVTNIVVADGGWSDTDRTFDVVGIRELANRVGVKLVDLNNDERVTIQIPGAAVLKDVYIAKTVLECDSIINVAKLKIHVFATVTLSIKNLMGVMLPKIMMHTNLDEKLVDLASLIKPTLNIIDGTVGCERSEYSGDPVPMDVIIGGRDIVAVDVVGSLVMGVNPHKVGYLPLAAKRGIGTMNLEDIEVIGEKIEHVKKRFRHRV
jgi:uncharacterized protein (DUF362 family)